MEILLHTIQYHCDNCKECDNFDICCNCGNFNLMCYERLEIDIIKKRLNETFNIFRK